MKKDFMPVVASASAKKVVFAIFCCTLLMLFTAPAWAQDTCQAAGAPAVCGITITISGSTGHLTAAIAPGAGEGFAYDGDEDRIIGIINSSSVAVGAIRLSAPPINGPPYFTSNLFNFDGDGPACYAPFGLACSADPLDYEGPNNIFVGISSDYTTGTVRFTIPTLPGGIPPGGSTWFALENTPAAVVSIGETQSLTTGVTNVFPFGPFTCTSDGCGPGSGTWTEQTPTPLTPAVDDFLLTPLAGVTGADYWTVLPIPVPAGPLGVTGTFGSFNINVPPVDPFFGNGQFGDVTPTAAAYGPTPFFTGFQLPNVTNQPLSQNSLACSPYTDYSLAAAQAAGQPDGREPTCVEIERDCSGIDCSSPTLLWQARFDYDQDSNSIPFLVGGPAVLFVPDVPGPTSPSAPLPFSNPLLPTDFITNALTAYTGATPTPETILPQDKPPATAGGGDGKSVFVTAFSPNVSTNQADQIPNGVTVGFPGFEVPTSNTRSPSCSKEAAQYLLFPSGKQESIGAILPVNCLFAVKIRGVQVPVPWLLVWDDTTTSNTPITNLQLCQTVGSGGACTTPPLLATTNWVHLSLVPVNNICTSGVQNQLSGTFTNLANTHPAFPGQYTFLWTPVSNPAGCQVAPVLQLNNNGTITYASPAVFVYSF